MNSKIRKLLSSERGEGRGKFFLTIIILASILYLAIKFVPPFAQYLKISSLTDDFVYQYGDEPDFTIRGGLGPKIKAIKSDLGSDDIEIIREGGKTTITIDYSVKVVLIPEKYDKVLDFHVEKSNR